MYEGIDCLFEDTEIEDTLLRNVIECNEKFLDARSWSEPKCKALLTDEELKRYEKILPGTDLSTRRRKIIKLLRENPSLRSTNPDVLFQRASFFIWKYGEKSQQVRRRKKCPLKKTVEKVLSKDHPAPKKENPEPEKQ